MIRQTLRSLWKSPGFALASVLALALSIGANIAIFSLVNAVLLRPLPYKDPGRLVMLLQRNPSGAANDASAADFEDWRDRSHSFEQLAAFYGASFNLTGSDRPERLSGLRVTASFFATLGITPTLGNVFASEEERPGAGRSVVISDSLWRRRFGGDRSIIGKTIHLDRQPYQVVGVMPAGIRFFDDDNQLWVPLPLESDRGALTTYYNLTALARLKPGVAVQSARAEMDGIARQLAQEYPKTNRGWGIEVTPLREKLTGNVRLALLVLLAAVAFVLLIACVNVANLLLVRAAGRRKEFAIRCSLGAGRMDIARRLLTESLLLAAFGGLVGTLLARWSIAALVALSPSDIPRLAEVSIDWRVLAFTAAISLLTGILFGLAPAAQFSNLDCNEVLKEGGRGISDQGGRFTRSVLVVAEVALALVLLAGAGLMIRSLAALESANTGFPTANLLTMNVTVPSEQYANELQMGADLDRALERIRILPGVLSAATATNLPVGDWNQGRIFTIEGRLPKPNGEVEGAGYSSVSPGYFRTVGLRLLRGREFTPQDRSGASDVVLISESMARRFWPNENPIGKRLICGSIQFGKRALGPPVPREIVGIVSDVRHVGHDAETSVEMYVPQLQNTIPFTYFLVRTAGDPIRLAPAVARAVNQVLKDSPLTSLETLDQRLSRSFARPRFQMSVLGLFAGLALLLATLGIYAVMSYAAAQRTQEIGIRMALGADERDVLTLVLGNALKLAAAGIAIGLLGAWASTRLMASLLYGVAPTDALTFAAVSIIIVVTAALASFIPAWRAAKTDPAATLRSQL